MDDDDVEQTASCHHDRWYIIQSTDPNKSASKLSLFVIDKALKCSVGTVKTVRCLRQGDILIEVSSATQSYAVTKLNNLAGCPVTASPHRTLSTCKGIIRCRPLVDCEKQEVLAEMKSQGVVNIENIGHIPTSNFAKTCHSRIHEGSCRPVYSESPSLLQVPEIWSWQQSMQGD